MSPPCLLLLLVLLPLALPHLTQQQAYLAQLLDQLANIQDILARIQLLNYDLDRNVQLTNQQASEKTLRVTALQDEHELALNLWKQVFLHNQQKTWNCPAIKAESYSSLVQQVHLINSTASSNLMTLRSEPYCLRNQQMIFQNEFISRTMQGLSLQLVQKCQQAAPQAGRVPFLELQTTSNYPNLNVQNAWTYGNLTPQEFQHQLSKLKNLFNASPCPTNLPFVNANNQCSKCERDGQVYDVSLKACRLCEGGCHLGGGRFNSHPKALNYQGNDIKVPSILSCQEQQPFYNGQRCLSCNLPHYFNHNTKQCEACPEGTGFNLTSKNCVSNIFYITFSGQLQNYIGGPFSPPPFATLKHCNQTQPYSNGKICTTCSLPHFYNYHTGQCQSCPAGLLFSVSRHSCGGGKGAKINSNLMGSRNFVGQVPKFDRIYGVCPLDSRFFNGIQCISCELPLYYDFSTSACTGCPAHQAFDLSVQHCVTESPSFVTNLNNRNIYYNGDFTAVAQSINTSKIKGIRQCPLSTPFYDPKIDKCKACPGADALFDIRWGNCFSCPTGSRFDLNSRICLANQVPLSIERMIMNGFL